MSAGDSNTPGQRSARGAPGARVRREGPRGGDAPRGAQRGQPTRGADGQRRDGEGGGRRRGEGRGQPQARGDAQPRREDRRSTDGRPGRGQDPRGAPSTPRLEALEARTRLDLELSSETPLSPAELEEARSLLAFLRRFKGALRLSLNAAEDLLVNGAREPEDRGVLKHLFAKVDRAEVEGALSREPLRSQVGARSAFLAGVVRLSADAGTLVAYLETLVELREPREAAAALELTVSRIDFEQLAPAQLARLVELLPRIFSGHERVQAALGLLASPSFTRALERARTQLSPELTELFGPLAIAHRVVMRGARAPDDERERALLVEGVERWLSAPDATLRAYSLAARARLARYVATAPDALAPRKVPRALFDSLPHKDPLFAELALPWAEKLLRQGEDEAARGFLGRVADTHPELGDARRWREALAWPQLGRCTVAPTSDGPADRYRRGFWLDGATFGWVRTAPPEGAGALIAEAKLQAELLVPGVLPALTHGLARDGTAYVFFVAEGRPLGASVPALDDALRLALEGVRILRALAAQSVTLPDAELARFVVRGRPPTLLLADLSSATASDPSRAALSHAPLAQALAARLLSRDPSSTAASPREDLPAQLADRLRARLPLVLLGRALAEALAKRSGGRGQGAREEGRGAPS
jgi:hypothetical protein